MTLQDLSTEDTVHFLTSWHTGPVCPVVLSTPRFVLYCVALLLAAPYCKLGIVLRGRNPGSPDSVGLEWSLHTCIITRQKQTSLVILMSVGWTAVARPNPSLSWGVPGSPSLWSSLVCATFTFCAFASPPGGLFLLQASSVRFLLLSELGL